MIIRALRVDVSKASRRAVILCVLLTPSGLGAQSSGSTPPRGPGFLERARVTLLLLEVEAVDRKGRPIPGLARSDFVVRLDGRLWPVATLDDRCSAEATGPEVAGAEAAGAGGPAVPDSGASPSIPPRADAVRGERFVLYMDFSEMTLSGRVAAIGEARRWVAESMRPEDEAMLAGYSTKAGLVVLQDFTAQREALAAALDRVVGDTNTIDDFPNEFFTRNQECETFPETCIHNARLEYFFGRQSLKALEAFLGRLEAVPGRKHLILFHENGMLTPGEVYGRDVGDHVTLTNEVDAEATASQTAIYTARVGGVRAVETLEKATRTLGSRLAEGTGGRYNLGASDLPRVVAGAGSRGRCMYVLGLEPPAQSSRRIYTARVVARGVTLPAFLQVLFRTDEDRWLVKASAVLENPGEARDVPLTAAILPLRARRGRWTIAVQVAVDEDALVQIPSAGRSRGEWEIGAMLQSTEGRGKWEVFGSFTIARPAEIRSSPVLIHEQEIGGLRPGAYRLTAFVRDRIANVFGGAQALMSLPDPRRGGGSGPVLAWPRRLRIVSALPLLGHPPAADTAGRRDVGSVPAASIALVNGETADVLTWICPGENAAAPSPRRFLVKDEVPIFRLPESPLQPAGDCFLLDEPIGTQSLGPGHYTYELQWERPGDTVRLEQPIEVIAPRETRADPP